MPENNITRINTSTFVKAEMILREAHQAKILLFFFYKKNDFPIKQIKQDLFAKSSRTIRIKVL